jgi:hypothetical protein
MAYVSPKAQPTFECNWLRSAAKRRTFPSRRLALAVRRYMTRAVEQSQVSVAF